jgi:hypothetical protein
VLEMEGPQEFGLLEKFAGDLCPTQEPGWQVTQRAPENDNMKERLSN